MARVGLSASCDTSLLRSARRAFRSSPSMTIPLLRGASNCCLPALRSSKKSFESLYQPCRSFHSHDRDAKDTPPQTDLPPSRGPPPGGPPYDILFCGNDSFSVGILKAVYQRKDLWNSLYVLTGSMLRNPNEVVKYSLDNGIPMVRVSKSASLELNKWDLPRRFQDASHRHLLLTASFGRLIPTSMLNHFTASSNSLALNVHPSMLPKLRGAAPIQWAIARQLAETGVTVQQLSRGAFDQGDILAQRPVSIPPSPSYADLLSLLTEQSADLLLQTLEDLPAHHQASKKQDSTAATTAYIPSRHHFVINWAKMTSEQIEALWRGFEARGRGLSTWLAEIDPRAVKPYVPVALMDLRLPHRSFFEDYPRDAARLAPHDVPVGSACMTSYDFLDAGLKFNGRIMAIKTLSPESNTQSEPNRDPQGRKVNVIYVLHAQTEGRKAMTAYHWLQGYHTRQNEQGICRFHSFNV